MNEAATKMNPQDELVEVLLDFIIVSVCHQHPAELLHCDAYTR